MNSNRELNRVGGGDSNDKNMTIQTQVVELPENAKSTEELDALSSPNVINIWSQNPAEAALLNHVVIQKIFKCIKASAQPGSTDLKNGRLVCSKWNSVLVSQNPPRFTLLLNKIPDDFLVDKKLTRSILCSGDSTNRVEEFYAKYAPRLEGFYDKYGEFVEHVVLQSLAHLQFLLQSGKCPNLSSIDAPLLPQQLNLRFEIPLLPNLRRIYLDWLESEDMNVMFLRNLVAVSPNLEELDVFRAPAFALHLNRNRKLKKLTIRQPGALNMKQLAGHLHQVAHSLEELNVLVLPSENKYKFDDCPEFPELRRLTTLKLLGVHNPHLKRLMGCFGPNFYPNLKTLWVSNRDTPLPLCFLEDLMSCSSMDKPSLIFRNVTTLVLKNIIVPRVLAFVRRRFPKVENLEVHQGPMIENGSMLPFLFSSVANLRLKNLKIHILNKFELIQLIFGLNLSYESLFPGLETLRIEIDKPPEDILAFQAFYPYDPEKRDSFSELEMALLHTKEFSGLEVYFRNFAKFQAVTWNRIMGLVLQNKLPVHFSFEEPYDI